MASPDKIVPASPRDERKAVPRLVVPDFAPSSRRRRIVAALVLAALAAAAFFAFRPTGEAGDLLRTERVERRTLTRTIAISGHLDVSERVELPSPTSARLLSIEVEVGDTVAEGQPLARLDPRQVDLAVGSAQAAMSAAGSRVTAARISLDAARDDLARFESLVPGGLASPADVAAARVRVDHAEASYQMARADQSAASTGLVGARLGRDFAVMRAPIAGVVLSAPRNIGGLVGPERGPLFVIGTGLSVLRVDAAVGEADVGEVRVGQVATFEVPAYIGRTFTATVTHIDPQAQVQPGATTFGIRLRAENPEGLLRSGMTTMLRIEVARAENVLSVHEAALRFVPEGAAPGPSRGRLWVRTGPSRVEPIDVTPGVSDGAFTAITAADTTRLREGAEVAIGMQATENGRGAGLSIGARGRSAGAP